MSGEILGEILIIAAFLLINVIFGLLAHRLGKHSVDDYFLAGRSVGPIVLFFTLIATNFSAFFFLGFAGAGYRIGYSYYGIMSFGTALVALAFYFLADRAWRLGKKHGYVTPPEMVGDLLGSKTLKLIYAFVMVFFTMPYLAIQPIGAGILLSNLFEHTIPYFGGAVGLTIIIVLYVFAGGMRSVAWTDVLQGVLMITVMGIAVFYIAEAFGGLTAANRQVFAMKPELFSRQGASDYFTPKLWFSYMVLWILCVPMFPQMFMRFFIAKSIRPIQVTAILLPIVTAVLFICPIIIGVIGHIPFPDLTGTASDNILPMMLANYAPGWLAALIMVGALAAFMSTMDSQLLALSSILTRDVYLGFLQKQADQEKQFSLGRILIVILALIGLAIAYEQPDTIFRIARQTFTGLAVLFPTTLAALYWRKTTATACIASIVVGELLVIGFHFQWIPSTFAFGFLPVIPIVLIAALTIIVVSLIFAKTE